MKDNYLLKKIGEILAVFVLFMIIAECSFWLMYLNYFIFNILGFLLLLSDAVSIVFYIINTARQVNNDLGH
jgi:hypothetical protein